MNLGIESETLEFKKSTSELKEGLCSICSILNKHGAGTLYFGVNSKGEVIGQQISEETLRDISKSIAEYIKPTVVPTVERLFAEEKQYIKVDFYGFEKPYSYNGKYYIRSADEDRLLSTNNLKKLLKHELDRNMWEVESTNTKVSAIDKDAIKAIYKDAIKNKRLPNEKISEKLFLKKLNLVNNLTLNNAGRVLFAKDEPVTLKMGVFATDEKLTFIEQHVIKDNIYNLLIEAEKFILKNIHWKTEVIGMYRVETPEIPKEAIREILANSFVHAVYVSNTTHEIDIHPSFITIYNPGQFASSHKPEDYIKKNIPSVVRNPLIANTLYLGNIIEQFGSGLKRVALASKDSGNKISFENLKEGFKVMITRKKDKNVTLNVTLDVTLNATEMLIYNLLKTDNTMSREKLAKKIGKTVRTIQRALITLTDKGYIQRKGSKNNCIWEILKE